MVDTVLFQDERPDVHLLEDIYDPDNSSSTGTIIPRVGSLVCVEPGGTLYYVVTAVSDLNKSTLTPLSVLATDDNAIVSIVDYTNARLHVFFDDREEPTKLNVDSLLLITGINNAEYVLTRVNTETKEEEVVSVYYDTNGEFVGNRIPMKLYSGTTAKYCSNCHTLLTLSDNEIITMQVFDNAGTQSAEVTLFAKRAVILNDLEDVKIITDFQLNSVQEKDGVIQLYQKQDISSLLLTPTVVYNTGETEVIPVDDSVCFIYGLDDIIASYPGLKQTIMCKYFLRPSQQATNAVDHIKGRFVVVERDIVVQGDNLSFSVKLSIIPIWNSGTSSYSLKFYLYSTTREHAMDVTSYVTMVSAFVGNDFDNVQELEYSIPLHEIFDYDSTNFYVQKTWLRLKPWNFGVEKYIIKDTSNDNYAYGVESSTFRRPVIHFDESLEQYFIPTSVFANKEAFIESTYTRSHPLYNNLVELSEPTPTHFTVRNLLTGNTIITSPIPVDEYSQVWTSRATGDADQFVNTTVLIEFLVEVDDSYQIVYGVPLECYVGAYNES